MDVPELVRALLAGDLLAVRQSVADAQRAQVQWERLEQPRGLSERELCVAAGIVELLASRSGGTPPSWTQTIGPMRDLLVSTPDWNGCRAHSLAHGSQARNRFGNAI